MKPYLHYCYNIVPAVNRILLLYINDPKAACIKKGTLFFKKIEIFIKILTRTILLYYVLFFRSEDIILSKYWSFVATEV